MFMALYGVLLLTLCIVSFVVVVLANHYYNGLNFHLKNYAVHFLAT